MKKDTNFIVGGILAAFGISIGGPLFSAVIARTTHTRFGKICASRSLVNNSNARIFNDIQSN